MQRHTNISARLRSVLLGLAIVIAPLSAPLMGSAALAATSATVSVDTAVTRGAMATEIDTEIPYPDTLENVPSGAARLRSACLNAMTQPP